MKISLKTVRWCQRGGVGNTHFAWHLDSAKSHQTSQLNFKHDLVRGLTLLLSAMQSHLDISVYTAMCFSDYILKADSISQYCYEIMAASIRSSF